MMRSENEMLDMIRAVARSLDQVRAVVLQGSRVNPKVPKDPFQDFDIVYLVDSLKPLTADTSWLAAFGERLIMQTPQSMQLPIPATDGHVSFLMLFTDGNRIDLTLIPLLKWNGGEGADSLSSILLDKDGRFPNFPPPDDRDYWVKRPSEKRFQDCCNEFWWTSTYVAKGLARNQILYAKAVKERIVRPMFDQMVSWYIGVMTGFSVNVGKNGQYFERYLPQHYWRELLDTYTGPDLENMWKALLKMGPLFEAFALEAARELQVNYPLEEAQNVRSYLEELRASAW